jgi:hypothetical protein
MRPETESLEGQEDSLAKAMRFNARVAFCLLLSDSKDRTLGRSQSMARKVRIRALHANTYGGLSKNTGDRRGRPSVLAAQLTFIGQMGS